MSDELTPSDDTASDDPLAPGRPQGAPAPSDIPIHDQPTAAGQAPAGALEGEPDLPADDTAGTLPNDALRDEAQP
jgi:hypothetical protein